jgi:adenylylsulfate kinase
VGGSDENHTAIGDSIEEAGGTVVNRNMIRQMVREGNFIEIYCNCCLDVCESRDVKGIYARARRGEIPEFTGISAPYERPENPEIVIDTENRTIENCVSRVINYLAEKGIVNRDIAELLTRP